MKEKIISISTLTGSLIGYGVAKTTQKDATPYVMVGAFMGNILGEAIANIAEKYKSNKTDKEE